MPASLQVRLCMNLHSWSGRFALLLLGCCLGWSAATAQNPSKWCDLGDRALEQGDYRRAIECYEWADRKGTDLRAAAGLGRCWRALMDYGRAGTYYARLVEQEGAPVETYFYYGQCLMAQRKYADAERWFARYTAAAPGDQRAAAFRDLDRLVAAVMGDSTQYEVQRLPINGPQSDFSPCYLDGMVLFATSRSREVGVIHRSTVNDAPLLDIYSTLPDTQGHWSKPKPYDALNTKLNEGPMAYDSLTGTLYITRNDPNHQRNKDKGARRGLNRLEIQAYSRMEGQWVAGKPLPFNNHRYAVGHPALSPDGNQLYFASDMPGGFGAADLYVSTLEDGAWGSPVNLGPGINTAGNELFPFVDSSSQLYFASDGHVGLGGLDVFTVGRTGAGNWGRVQNLGYPLNSSSDDFGLVLAAGGNSGLLSSNRGDDPQDDNIYAFRRFWPRFECVPQLKNNYCYFYYESGVLDADSMPLAYEWDFGDGFRARGLEARHCYDGPGTYTVQLNLVDTLLSYLFLTQTEYTLKVSDTEQVFIDAPDRIAVGSAFTVSAAKSVLAGCSLEQWFWEMGDGHREMEQTFTYQYDSPGTYEIKLGVQGNPEDDGNLVCKACVTKTIEVMPLPDFQHLSDSVAAERQRALDRQAAWRHSELAEQLLDSGATVVDLRDSLKASHSYSVLVSRGKELIDRLSPRVAQLRDLNVVRRGDEFELYSGRSDSLAGIRPYFVEAHQQGFDDAVVVLIDDPSDVPAAGKQYVSIPAKRTELGYTLFSGQVAGPDGTPLEAEVTFEDLETGVEVFRGKSDSLGRVEVKLPNGNTYVWSAEIKDYFPASGYLDLVSAASAPGGTIRLRERIAMRTMTDVLESGEPVRINNIFFDFDSDHLRPESRHQLDRLSTLLNEYPDFGVTVQAHTDDVGNDAYNLDLSRRRAASVVKYMEATGLSSSRLHSQGYGESVPAVSNDTAEHRQFNRRVEFTFFPIGN